MNIMNMVLFLALSSDIKFGKVIRKFTHVLSLLTASTYQLTTQSAVYAFCACVAQIRAHPSSWTIFSINQAKKKSTTQNKTNTRKKLISNNPTHQLAVVYVRSILGFFASFNSFLFGFSLALSNIKHKRLKFRSFLLFGYSLEYHVSLCKICIRYNGIKSLYRLMKFSGRATSSFRIL